MIIETAQLCIICPKYRKRRTHQSGTLLPKNNICWSKNLCPRGCCSKAREHQSARTCPWERTRSRRLLKVCRLETYMGNIYWCMKICRFHPPSGVFHSPIFNGWISQFFTAGQSGCSSLQISTRVPVRIVAVWATRNNSLNSKGFTVLLPGVNNQHCLPSVACRTAWMQNQIRAAH